MLLFVAKDKNAGLISNVSFLEISIPEKYWFLKLLLTEISTVNAPIGYLPKSISTENKNDVVGIYLDEIDRAPLNPPVILAINTELQFYLQSWAESNKAFGKWLSLTLTTTFPNNLDCPLFSIEIAVGTAVVQVSRELGDPPKHE